MVREGRRRIPILLAAATMIPIVVSAWLGVRLLQQDRAIERQRQREHLEVAAGRLALDIGRTLQEIEDALGHEAGPTLPSHALGADGISSPPVRA